MQRQLCPIFAWISKAAPSKNRLSIQWVYANLVSLLPKTLNPEPSSNQMTKKHKQGQC